MSADRANRRRAIEETGRSFVVEASAGTGKTSVLVERILHCVLHEGPEGVPLPLARICAITFTEKAAGEMKLRLREEFERRAAEPGSVGDAALQALVDLESASISTFHSFAVAMLKERPVEAGLDPRFTALDAVQSDLFFQEVWEGWLQQAIQERRPRLEQALRAGLRLSALRTAAHTLREHVYTVRNLQLVAPPSEEETKAHLAEMLEKGTDLRKLARKPDDKLIALLDDARSWLADPGGEVTPRKPGNKGAAGGWQGGKDTVQEVRDFVRSVADWAPQVRLLPVRRALDGVLRLIIEDFLPAWADHKRVRGFLDFDDQLWCAHDLLASCSAAREEFQNRFAALLIDEFQDTDPVQWEIVRMLASVPDLARTGGGAIGPGRLFIVGDPKQSIYRFRGADIETYGNVTGTDSMKALGLERLELTTNFRSVPCILDFVDSAFRDVMREEENKPYQPSYLAFGGRGFRTGKSEECGTHLLGDRSGNGDAAGTGPEFIQREAIRIAGLITTMCRGDGWKIQERRSSLWRAPGFRDIAVLLPVLTHADVLEEALREAGIPYVLEGGKFYYARSEVSSAITVLRAIANPNDSVALYGALRSIFFGLSDEDLLRARIEGIPLDYRTNVPASSDLAGPYRVLHELHLRRHERTASETLECLFGNTGAREVLAVRGVQSLANLNKLVRTLRSLQKDAAFSEVIDLIGSMDEEGIAEGESRIMEEHSDAVRILSIHRAKGLDFPIVIAAGLGLQRRSRQTDFLADPHINKTFALRLGSKHSGLQTPGWERLAEAEKEKEEAELIRLLYVAMTRARDHLVVSTHARGRRIRGTDEWAAAFESTRLKSIGEFLTGLFRGDGPEVDFVTVTAAPEAPASRSRADAKPQQELESILASRYLELRRLLDETPHARGIVAASAATREKGTEESVRDMIRDQAIRLGLAFHDVMSTLNLEGMPDPESLAHSFGTKHGLDSQGRETLHEMLLRTFGSRLLDRVRLAQASGGRIFRELPYIRLMGEPKGSVEEGKIDLLFEESGAWILVDYKTDRIPEETQNTDLYFQEQYGGQVHAYRSALQEAGIQVASACLLLARTGEEIEIPSCPIS